MDHNIYKTGEITTADIESLKADYGFMHIAFIIICGSINGSLAVEKRKIIVEGVIDEETTKCIVFTCNDSIQTPGTGWDINISDPGDQLSEEAMRIVHHFELVSPDWTDATIVAFENPDWHIKNLYYSFYNGEKTLLYGSGKLTESEDRKVILRKRHAKYRPKKIFRCFMNATELRNREAAHRITIVENGNMGSTQMPNVLIFTKNQGIPDNPQFKIGVEKLERSISTFAFGLSDSALQDLGATIQTELNRRGERKMMNDNS